MARFRIRQLDVTLDVTMNVVGEYVPAGECERDGREIHPPYPCLSSTGGAGKSFVDAIQGVVPPFFDALLGVCAVDDDDLAEPPTVEPELVARAGVRAGLRDQHIDPDPGRADAARGGTTRYFSRACCS